MAKKTYSNKTTVKKKSAKTKSAKKVKPKGGGPSRTPCTKNGMGPRKLRP